MHSILLLAGNNICLQAFRIFLFLEFTFTMRLRYVSCIKNADVNLHMPKT